MGFGEDSFPDLWTVRTWPVFCALSKVKLTPQKDHGHCLVVCCQSDPLQFSESQGNHYI